jgi:hypothetical protein
MNTALRCTTSTAAGNDLGNTIKYLQRITSGAAGNGRAKRPSTCDAQQAVLRATAWAPRSSTCAPPRASAGTTIKYLRGAAGIRLATTIK